MNATPPSSPAAIESWEVLDLLASLVQKSLVVYEEDEQGGGRYHLLETVRQYARDRLLETREVEVVRERHCDCFATLLEEAEPRLSGPTQDVWLERLEREHDNLRAALAWTVAKGEGDAGLRLAQTLAGLWQMRGYFEEGRQHLAALLALPGAQRRTAARAKGLRHAGVLAEHQEDHAEAGSLLEESLMISREIGDPPLIAWCLWSLGHHARRRGDYGAARAFFEESQAIFGQIEGPGGVNPSLQGMAEVAHGEGDYATARALLEECLAVDRRLGNENGLAWDLYHFGSVALSQKEYGTAHIRLAESLRIFRKLGQRRGIAHDLEKMAAAAAAQGRSKRAARLAGAAAGLRATIGLAIPPADRVEYERSVAAARTALGAEAFAAAWAEGQGMSLEDAIRSALAEGEPSWVAPAAKEGPPPPGDDPS